MVRRFLFFVLVASASGHTAFAEDGVLSVDLVGGYDAGPLISSLAYGDFGFDGVVDAADLTVWRGLFGLELFLGSASFFGPEAGFDGRFDGGDFLTWQRNLGRTTFPLPGSLPPSSPVTAVPEPTSMIQLLLAGASVALARRRSWACRV
jgi:hypothetical protein